MEKCSLPEQDREVVLQNSTVILSVVLLTSIKFEALWIWDAEILQWDARS